MYKIHLEIPEQIKPEFLKLMNDLEPEYRALEIKVGERIKTMLNITVINEDGEDRTEDLDPEQFQKVRGDMIRLYNVINMIALVGWHCISKLDDKAEAMLLIQPLMGMLNKSINESLAYNSVRSATKH